MRSGLCPFCEDKAIACSGDILSERTAIGPGLTRSSGERGSSIEATDMALPDWSNPSGKSATSGPGVRGQPSEAPLIEYDEWLRDMLRGNSAKGTGGSAGRTRGSTDSPAGTSSESGGPALGSS